MCTAMIKKIILSLLILSSINPAHSFKNSSNFNDAKSAIAENNMQLFELICRRGLDVNQAAPDGLTLLILAIQQRNRNAVTILLDHGVDINGVHLINPLLYAFKMNSMPLILLLLEHGAVLTQTMIQLAIAENNINIITFLNSIGYNPIALFPDHATPFLAMAIKSGNLKMVQLLIMLGADPFLQNSASESAFEFAQTYGTPAIRAFFYSLRPDHCPAYCESRTRAASF